jgi:hypothetical protein
MTEQNIIREQGTLHAKGAGGIELSGRASQNVIVHHILKDIHSTGIIVTSRGIPPINRACPSRATISFIQSDPADRLLGHRRQGRGQHRRHAQPIAGHKSALGPEAE